MRRPTIIANPTSGLGRSGLAALAIAREFGRRGIPCPVQMTGGAGDARAFARRLSNDVDFLVVVGGDGTLHEILNGLGRRRVPLGLYPAGTGNVLAAELGLPRSVRRAVDSWLDGREFRMDTFQVGTRRGISVLSAGFDAAVVRQVAQAREGGTTWPGAYLEEGAKELRNWKAPDLRVHVDGNDVGRASGVIVANVAAYGGRWMRLGDDHRLDDGRVETYLFRGRRRTDLLRYALRMGVGRRARGWDVQRLLASRVRVESESPVDVQVDGEPAGRTPVELEVESCSVTLRIP